MNDTNPPVQSLKSLFIASTVATLLASLVLVVFVLPAEYGIDPTGIGKKIGLIALAPVADNKDQASAIAMPVPVKQATEVSCADQTNKVAKTANAPQWQDTVKIIVPPKKGLEYKFHLTKAASLEYSWATDGTKLYFDFHGEPKGDKTRYFKSFKESIAKQSSGSLIAPFEGVHGWYWQNKTSSPVTIILNTKGSYQVLGLM